MSSDDTDDAYYEAKNAAELCEMAEDDLRELAQELVERIEDMLKGDDAQAWKEARKALVLAKEAGLIVKPEQEIDHVR